MKYLGNGAINQFAYSCAKSFEHCYESTRNLSKKYSNAGIVWTVCWIWYIIEVAIYFIRIFWDLLQGRPLWTPIPESRDFNFKPTKVVEIYNPQPQINPLGLKRNEAEEFIGNILKANRNTLKGIILNTTHRKIQEDELIEFTTTGILTKPAMKQYISFGPSINEKLYTLIGKSPKYPYVKRKGETCFVLNNGDYTPLTDKINELFNITNSKISLTEG